MEHGISEEMSKLESVGLVGVVFMCVCFVCLTVFVLFCVFGEVLGSRESLYVNLYHF